MTTSTCCAQSLQPLTSWSGFYSPSLGYYGGVGMSAMKSAESHHSVGLLSRAALGFGPQLVHLHILLEMCLSRRPNGVESQSGCWKFLCHSSVLPPPRQCSTPRYDAVDACTNHDCHAVSARNAGQWVNPTERAETRNLQVTLEGDKVVGPSNSLSNDPKSMRRLQTFHRCRKTAGKTIQGAS